jgi:glycosidase
VRDVGIDGYRCDVAEMVPTDFWNEARTALDKIKPVFMLSEGQYPEHHLTAFDATYSWNLYQLFAPLMKGERTVQAIDSLLATEAVHYPKQSIRMRFSSNHDENAWDNPDVVKFGLEGAKLAAVVVATFPGIPLLYNGQETGSAGKLGLFEKHAVDWHAHPDFREFYTKLFDVRKTHAALASGMLKRLESSDTAHVYAFTRSQGKETIAVVVNFSSSPRSTVISMPGANRSVRLVSLMMAPGVQSTINGTRVAMSLPAFGYGIFRVE